MELQILCGIPGSGKSTLVPKLKGYLVSTDEIRKFLWKDESVVKHDRLVFNLAETIIDYLFKSKENVIFDATNLTIAKRNRFINLAKKYKANVLVHWVNCPLQDAIERNLNRERKVPVAVIKALYKTFQAPRLEEGINVIKIYNKDLDITEVIGDE